MMRNPRLSKTGGFSVVEVMVAIAVALILLSGVLQLFTSTVQAYRVQDAIARLESAGQFAIELLARDIRGADYWGCVPALSSVTNQLNQTNPSFYSFVGVTGTANSSGTGGVIAGTDTLTLQGVNNTANGTTVSLQMPYPITVADPLTVGSGSGVTTGSLLLVSDCLTGDIFQATAVTATGAISHAGGAGSPGNISGSLSKVYTGQAFIYFPYTHIYNIQNGSDGFPALFRTTSTSTDEMVDNVQSMIVLFGEDLDNDTVANRYVRANAVTNMANVVSLRISLLLQTPENYLVTTAQPYTFNGTTVTPTDFRLRRVYTTTISLRNRSL